jgi:nifR3 family TIM-barrel protein
MTNSTSHISEPFSIGSLHLLNRLVQAPMAGISSRAFRQQARRFGVSLVYTEMISSYGVVLGNQRTVDMMTVTAGEHPVAVQLFGNRPDIMAEAAARAEGAGADLIDINMGCPVRKVVKTGAGMALMENEDLAVEIVATVVGSVRVPVVVKIRSGTSQVTAPSLGARLEAAGAAAVCIHPRLGKQGRKGKADHLVTMQLVDNLDIPVIASGDGCCREDTRQLLTAGCAAVMVGRTALGNPWIFSDLLADKQPRQRQLKEILAEMKKFYRDLIEEKGPDRGGRAMRKFYGWYLAPFKPGTALLHSLRQVTSFDEAEMLIRRELLM